MKKLLALLLVLLMVLSLAACGEKETQQAEDTDPAVTTAATTTAVTEETEPEEEMEEEEPQGSPYTVFEELGVAVIDNDDLSVTIGALETDSDGNLFSTVDIENRTDKDININFLSFAINAQHGGGHLNADLAAGETFNDVYSYYTSVNKDEVKRLSLGIKVSYEKGKRTYEKTYLIDIYPQGQDAYEEAVPQRSGTVIMDRGGIFVSLGELTYLVDDTPQIPCLIFNDSRKVQYIPVEVSSINGFAVESLRAFVGVELLPGAYFETTMDISDYIYLSTLGMESKITSLTVTVNYTEEYTLYPNGEENAVVFDYTPGENAVVVAENEYYRLLQIGNIITPYEEHVVLFLMESKTDMTIDAYLSGLGNSMNITADGGRKVLAGLNTWPYILDEMGVSKISSLELYLEIWDSSDNVFFEDTITFDTAPYLN